MPVYNAEATLAEAVDSVLSQSLQDLELVCVDDGSTDGSAEILAGYEARDPRVRVIAQQNAGAGAARNRGLEVARGEYVHFLDADDRVLPYAYECLCDKAEKHDLDVLRCAAVDWDVARGCYVDKELNSLSVLRPGDFGRLVGTEEWSPVFRAGVAPWAGIFRREFLLEHEIRFNELFCVNDRSFYAAAITNASHMMYSRDRVVFHRDGQTGSLVGGRAAHFDCQFRSIELVIERLEADGIAPEVQERVLGCEFDDLLAWYRRLGADPEHGASIREQTEAFVAGYDGPCANLLASKYEEAKKKFLLRRLVPLPADKEAKVEHEACEHPKVSVVVPVYNVEDYLNEALDSLVNQTLEEMEFICVNDGSTDRSLTIMREYAALDKRIRILDGPNGGYGKAMNRGIDAARGEYLGILEPDDFVPHSMFDALYTKAAANKVDFIKADFYRFKTNPDGSLREERVRIVGGKRKLGYYNRVLCPGDDQQVFRFTMNTWSGIYKLEFLNRWHIRHNETPGASYQDNGFFFQTFCRAERAMFVDNAFYMNRRDNPGSSMSNPGKLYAVTEEYNFIERWLKQDPALWEKFSAIFYLKKWDNAMATYRRVAPQLQLELFRHLRDEFQGPLEAGLIDEELLDSVNRDMLHEIVSDPDAFHDRIRVSVVMPVYNGERYLREALDDVLTGNAIQFEVICVDDGSTDATPEILTEFAERDPRVRVLTQQNAGAGAARNKGLEVARGEYLSFLDADDIFESGMLERAYKRARMREADLVVFRCDQCWEDTCTYKPTRWSLRREMLPDKDVFSADEISRDIFKVFVGWTWDKLFRADFIRENGLTFQEQRTTNDLSFTFAAVARARRITTMEDVLVHRRMYTGSLSTTRERSWHCFYDALLALRRQLKDWGLFERRERDFVNYSLHACLWNLSTLSGDAYAGLYVQLKDGWLEELGILGRAKGYFYNRDEYRQLQKLLVSEPEEFRTWEEGRRAGQEVRSRRRQVVRSLTKKVRRAGARSSGSPSACSG